MSKREFNYKNQVSKTGEFSPHITDKKLCKELDAYCLITNTNKTKYVVNAVKQRIEEDMKKLKMSMEDKND